MAFMHAGDRRISDHDDLSPLFPVRTPDPDTYKLLQVLNKHLCYSNLHLSYRIVCRFYCPGRKSPFRP